MSVMIFACKETPCDVIEDINNLNDRRAIAQGLVDNLNILKESKEAEIAVLDEKLKLLDIYASGRKPQYILKIHLKQSHFTLDIGKHIKDAANAIDFEIPVDKDFYNQVKEGTSIVDNFRMGSFILEGSFGNWDMTVSGKEIR
jgi:hypothetical protein